jgi:hypothetical protein
MKIELFNQYGLICILTIKLGFTGFINDSKTEFTVGWAYVGVTLLVMAGNVCNLIPMAIRGYKRLMSKAKY